MTSVLVATLGSEPQVVSLTTQLLLGESVCLDAVVVLHTACDRSPVDHALPLLQQTFAADRALPRLHCVSVPVDDVLTPAELETFADTLYQTSERRQSSEGD